MADDPARVYAVSPILGRMSSCGPFSLADRPMTPKHVLLGALVFELSGEDGGSR